MHKDDGIQFMNHFTSPHAELYGVRCHETRTILISLDNPGCPHPHQASNRGFERPLNDVFCAVCRRHSIPDIFSMMYTSQLLFYHRLRPISSPVSDSYKQRERTKRQRGPRLASRVAPLGRGRKALTTRTTKGGKRFPLLRQFLEKPPACYSLINARKGDHPPNRGRKSKNNPARNATLSILRQSSGRRQNRRSCHLPGEPNGRIMPVLGRTRKEIERRKGDHVHTDI